MIYWVYQAAKACPKLDDVLIATDDERIADACKAYDTVSYTHLLAATSLA